MGYGMLFRSLYWTVCVVLLRHHSWQIFHCWFKIRNWLSEIHSTDKLWEAGFCTNLQNKGWTANGVISLPYVLSYQAVDNFAELWLSAFSLTNVWLSGGIGAETDLAQDQDTPVHATQLMGSGTGCLCEQPPTVETDSKGWRLSLKSTLIISNHSAVLLK